MVTGGGNYIPVIGWRINQIEKITWMICAGVDGIYTDNIGDVKSLKVRQANNDITCCMEDKITPCLPPYDPRLMGQGCSSMGLTYYDLETAACPLVGIDLLYTGTQLTCRQLKFCPVWNSETISKLLQLSRNFSIPVYCVNRKCNSLWMFRTKYMESFKGKC